MPKTRALIGINSIPLSDRLKELEKYGLIQRETLAETLPRVEYSLSVQSIQLSIPSLLECLLLFPV
jgi:DNA-binding HxlR family transcriptional regulator